MNYGRLALASFGGFMAYFVTGGLMSGLFPSLAGEFQKYPAVYRSQEEVKTVIPLGLGAILLAIVVLVVIYSMLYRGGSGLAEGSRFGALIGVFSICAFVIHNYINLNIGVELAVKQGAAYFVEWLVTGAAIGLIYRPVGQGSRPV